MVRMNTLNARHILLSGTLLAGLAVALGAFGSHALETITSPERIGTWQTAVRYQLFHALALLVLGVLANSRPPVNLTLPAGCFILGTLLFSGSLYLLVLLDQPILGAITPLGGLLYLLGWSLLFFRLLYWLPE